VVLAPSTETKPANWYVGEHVFVVGDTGTGKTTLISKLVRERQYVIVFRTKADDIKFPGFKVSRTADILDDLYADKILLAPRYERLALEGYRMFEKTWRQRGWTVVIDELWFVESELGLKQQSIRLLTQGRSQKMTAVVGVQRPAFISRFALSQSTHLFSFRLDGRDVKTIRDATTTRLVPYLDPDSPQVLPDKRFAYYHRANREIRIGNARQLEKVIQIPRRGT
jgi:hypothetical protein